MPRGAQGSANTLGYKTDLLPHWLPPAPDQLPHPMPAPFACGHMPAQPSLHSTALGGGHDRHGEHPACPRGCCTCWKSQWSWQGGQRAISGLSPWVLSDVGGSFPQSLGPSSATPPALASCCASTRTPANGPKSQELGQAWLLVPSVLPAHPGAFPISSRALPGLHKGPCGSVGTQGAAALCSHAASTRMALSTNPSALGTLCPPPCNTHPV